jgi:hypothetical protein
MADDSYFPFAGGQGFSGLLDLPSWLRPGGSSLGGAPGANTVTGGMMPGQGSAIAPSAPSASTTLPAASAAGPSDNLLDALRSRVNANSNMLLGFAGGLAGGHSWGDGLSKGFASASQGSEADAKARTKAMTPRDLYQALTANNVPPQQAFAAAQSGNSDILKFTLQKYGRSAAAAPSPVPDNPQAVAAPAPPNTATAPSAAASASIVNAKAAIAANPSIRDAVIARLRDHGIDPSGL